jgi:phospholipase/carboxylesterase
VASDPNPGSVAEPQPSDPHARTPVLHAGVELHAARGAVLCLHGRGARASDILKLADVFSLPGLAYLAPEAAGQSWYPVSFLAPREQNQAALESALRRLRKLLRRLLAAGLPHHRIALAGFSQGACLVSQFAALHPARYGALLIYTGGLIGPPGTAFDFSGDLAGTPVIIGGGDRDPHVPWSRMQETAAVLEAMGGQVKLECYPGLPHVIHQNALSHGRRMLESMLLADP